MRALLVVLLGLLLVSCGPRQAHGDGLVPGVPVQQHCAPAGYTGRRLLTLVVGDQPVLYIRLVDCPSA